MDAPNATFFIWCAKYFEWGWVVDVVQMALLIIYKVCVWLGVGWAIAYRTMCREQWLRVFFLAFIAKQNWMWKAIGAT